ncbi:hypothetical protein SEA_VANLEE_115 [Gordonia phage VanLee]|uniref:Uncharacterized protein n=1 Tax=Gordonia phage VanLee TaxID=2845816 RepID=A0A8F2IFJ1_9CAUD|nr:hypothetical protein QEH49_gp115 [Gordonia phage VanLee]QWS68232.1 hypothetical protein SEA_VANLEE_115 [Gordonia phage VanLee]
MSAPEPPPEEGEGYQEPVNPVQVEAAIRHCANRIARGVRIVSDRLAESKAAKRAYDEAFARALLNAPGAVATKKYHAVLATTEEAAARDVADVALDYARDTARALEKELDALRSIGASTRQMYSAGGMG